VRIVTAQAKVDTELCTGCLICESVCPTLSIKGGEDLIIEKREKVPCVSNCPAGTNVHGYVALADRGKYEEALSLIKETLPIPRVLGRICPAPCEEKCNRRLLEEPLAIRAIKRFVADTAKGKAALPEIEEKEQKVAIIGSGPAGLSCAYWLRLKGFKVTIFEALPVPGGMLRVGIPDYRLPKDVLAEEIKEIADLGVEIKTNTPVGKELTIDDLLKQGYESVFISVGAHRSQRLGIPGEDTKGVIHGLALLRDINLGKEVKTKGKVVVIGGGDVAIDSARSALRSGAKEVTILYRRTRSEMPAREEEVEAAEIEGVKIEYLVAPTEILTKNRKVSGIKCTRMELGEPDASGRRRPIPIPGSEFDLKVDVVIPAIGQAPETSPIENSGIKTTKRGTIEVDPVTLETSRRGVFAGGDCQTGPSIAVEAVSAGTRAAESIIRYLSHQDIKEGRLPPKREPPDFSFTPLSRTREPRQSMPTIPLAERISGFEEIELGFSEELVVKEASRCLSCGICAEVDELTCTGCSRCRERCPEYAINLAILERRKVLEVDWTQVPYVQIEALCRRAHMNPLEVICYCTGTRAREVAASIILGAETPEEISTRTGVRTGCGVECIQPILRLLTAAGVKLGKAPGHQWYGLTPTIWDLPEEIIKNPEYQKFYFDEDRKLLEKIAEAKGSK
jgi:NADPH-dependent glutamate synthase beta subunit-like oxidoreductase/bacterioferritin-associated ferredoxin